LLGRSADAQEAADSLPPILTFRGDPSRSYQGSGPLPRNLTPLWTFQTGTHTEALSGGRTRTWKGTGWSGQPALAEGRVYVPGLDGVLYCRDALSGAAVWESAAKDSIKGSPCLWGDRILFGSRDNHLHCVSLQDGKELWTLSCGGKDVDSTPAAIGDRAWFGAEDTYVYCIGRSGKVLWRSKTRGSIESSPAIVDGRLYIGSYDGYLHCLSADDGSRLWTFPTGDDTDSSPVVVDDSVYIGSENGFVYRIDRKTGALRWRYRAGAGVWATPSVTEGAVFIAGDDGLVHCIDADTGQVRWRSNAVRGGMWGSTTVVDGLVVVGDWSGWLSALDAQTGGLVWQFETGSYIVSSACIHGGRIYIGARTGTFYCFGEAP
jgi:outer membrane protein assembly factor BamB